MHAFTNPARRFGLSDSETMDGATEVVTPIAQSLLTWLLDSLVVLPEEWDELPPRDRDDIAALSAPELLLGRLVCRHLLTSFQADAIRKGLGEELILGHYRLLDLLGQGGMGTVYRAEHVQLRRQVALKVMARSIEGNSRLLHRFYAEARAVARLQHPNIVTCLDAGRVGRSGPGGHTRDYFVMEFIPGQDLYGLIRQKGPLSPRRACELFRQVAEALGEAHRLGLVHRDIKPSNVLVTPDWQAKVLDFGLARLPSENVTEPGTLLGTVGYMAPEQAHDPHNVDARADLFGLGATMYWALTGREPFPETGNPVQDLHRRFTTTPPAVRHVRPEVPAEVSELVERLMNTDPDQRYPSARAVAAALAGFALWLPTRPGGDHDRERRGSRDRVLLVDDDPATRRLMATVLRDQYDVREAEDGDGALAELTRDPPDLAVVDVHLPGLCGPDLIGRLRSSVPDPERVKVLLVSGEVPAEALGGLAVTGADDFLSKPFSISEFQSRVRTLLLRRSVRPAGPAGLTAAGATVPLPVHALVRSAAPSPPPVRTLAAPEVLSFTVSRLLVETNVYGEGHSNRIVRYVRALAGMVADEGEYGRLKDDAYVDPLCAVAPVYDIGLLAVPRNVLMKPDKLDADERNVIQTHTTQGSQVLLAVAGRFAADIPALPMAAEVARSHHERWDATGYPDMLAGTEIPLSARVVAVAAVYEALRSRRPHRPPLSHARAVKIIATECAGQFDPTLQAAFIAAAQRFELIFQGG
jgi:response regulator RpfG family c-di-GMP phosphodiesterase/serine/threonine protein kinase